MPWFLLRGAVFSQSIHLLLHKQTKNRPGQKDQSVCVPCASAPVATDYSDLARSRRDTCAGLPNFPRKKNTTISTATSVAFRTPPDWNKKEYLENAMRTRRGGTRRISSLSTGTAKPCRQRRPRPHSGGCRQHQLRRALSFGRDYLHSRFPRLVEGTGSRILTHYVGSQLARKDLILTSSWTNSTDNMSAQSKWSTAPRSCRYPSTERTLLSMALSASFNCRCPPSP